LSRSRRCFKRWAAKSKFSFEDSEIREMASHLEETIAAKSLDDVLLFSLKKNFAIFTKLKRVGFADWGSSNFSDSFSTETFECLEMCRNKTDSKELENSSDKTVRTKSTLLSLLTVRTASCSWIKIHLYVVLTLWVKLWKGKKKKCFKTKIMSLAKYFSCFNLCIDIKNTLMFKKGFVVNSGIINCNTYFAAPF
jgi:hypothetical protein